MRRIRGIIIDPVDQTSGEMKSADDCFLEAFEKASGKNGSSNGSILKLAEPKTVAKRNRWCEDLCPSSWYAALLIRKYDKDWFEWEPETLWQTIEKDFKQTPSVLTKNKINAIKTILLTDAFWKEWNIFEKVVLAFNDHIPNFYSVEVPSPGEISWAVREANFVRPGVPWSDEVVVYVQRVCKDAGLVYYPDNLQFSQPKPVSQMASDVKSAWEMIKDQKNIKITENRLGINLVRLQAIQIYLDERSKGRE